jgi:hypothetical protein
MVKLKTAPTFVLVHGAWADGTSWHKVIDALEAGGAKAIAAPIPLTSVSDDVRALDRCLARIEGPVVLAAHAYAGAVISGSKNERVKGLVFVAALAPDEGETVGEVFGRGKPHPKAPQLAPDGDGFIWMPESAFAAAFAQNASPKENALFAAVQRPTNVACLQEKAPEAALEDFAVLVPAGGAGSHDQPRDAGLHGAADESHASAAGCGSYADSYGARPRRRIVARGRQIRFGLIPCD